MISVQCEQCQSKIRAKDSYAGRRVKCPNCQGPVHIPAEKLSAAEVAESDVATTRQVVQPNSPATDAVSDQPLAPPNVVPANSQPPVHVSPAPVGQLTGVPGDVPPLSSSSVSYGRRKRKNSAGVFVGMMALLIGGAAGLVYWLDLFGTTVPTLTIGETASQTAIEHQPLAFTVPVPARNALPDLEFELITGPRDARIKSSTGEFVWTPGETDGATEVDLEIRATAGDQSAETTIHVVVSEHNEPPKIELTDEIRIAPGDPIAVAIAATDPDEPSVAVTFSLNDAPPGAQIDPASGELTWQPGDEIADEIVLLTVVATEDAEEGLSSETTVTIKVSPHTDPYKRLVASLTKRGVEVEVQPGTQELPFGGQSRLVRLNGQPVHTFQYESPDAVAADAAAIDAETGTLFDKPWEQDETLHMFQDGTLLVACVGGDSDTLELLTLELQRAVATVARREVPPPVALQSSELVAALKELYEKRDPGALKKRMLFSTDEYKTVRKVFSDQWEKDHDADIHAAFGDSYDFMMEWFEEQPDIKEELFTAFTPDDDVRAGLELFKNLKEIYARHVDRYPSLAIAMAVVWDQEDRAIYDYANHQRRTHSLMPQERSDAYTNFQYLVEAEKVMHGRIQFAPWEFLAHIVNHRTPVPERSWALQHYGARRVGFGKCYKDVPYDTVMLQSSSQICRLDSKEYNFPNLVQFGGVCAMQADFAARIGKSIGVPAEYVSGNGKYGGSHAWVMWVELRSVNARGMTFSLESYGRYRGDNYYVGRLKDPQTGRGTTDRMLELKLHEVGADALAKRHSDRIMMLYPELKEELRLGYDGSVDFISQTLALNPWNQEAWRALSKLPAEQPEELDRLQKRAFATALNQLLVNFAPFPDFTLEIIDDLLQFEPDAEERIKLHYRLIELFAAANRPDLSFQGLTRLSEKLVEADRADEAMQAMAIAIQNNPDEGNYVPRLLADLENLAAKVEGGPQAMAGFYNTFLPKIPQKRGDTPSVYCMEMYERGIRAFQAAGQLQLAATYQAQLQLLEASKPTIN